MGGGRRAPLSNRKTHARLFHSPLLTVKTAMSEKALELEGWKELLKNKTWELTKPNITVRARAGRRARRKKRPRALRRTLGHQPPRTRRPRAALPFFLFTLPPPHPSPSQIAKELIKPNLTALKSEIEGMFDPIDFVKGMKDAKPSVHDLKMVDDEGKMMKDLKTELNDMYGMKANLTKVEKLVKKEMLVRCLVRWWCWGGERESKKRRDGWMEPALRAARQHLASSCPATKTANTHTNAPPPLLFYERRPPPRTSWTCSPTSPRASRTRPRRSWRC